MWKLIVNSICHEPHKNKEETKHEQLIPSDFLNPDTSTANIETFSTYMKLKQTKLGNGKKYPPPLP